MMLGLLVDDLRPGMDLPDAVAALLRCETVEMPLGIVRRDLLALGAEDRVQGLAGIAGNQVPQGSVDEVNQGAPTRSCNSSTLRAS